MLSSRERCLRAILLEEPDRIPLQLRIRPEPLEKLKKTLKVFKSGEDLGAYFGGNTEVCRKLGVDVMGTSVGLKGGYEMKGTKWVDNGDSGWLVGMKGEYMVLRTIFGYEKLVPLDLSRSYTYTISHYPLKDLNSLDEYSWPEVREEDFDQVERFRRKYEDYCLQGSTEQCFETALKLTGFEKFMVSMHRNPKLANEILDKLNELMLKQAKLLLEADFDVIYNGDDVGAQTGMFMSPELWRRYLKPRYRRLSQLIKKYGKYFMFHSDGWIEPIIPDLIEIGVDILNPVQPEIMDPAKIKSLYGDKICFDGTISIQKTMPFGTPEDVTREVKERIRTLGPTGLILGPSHMLQTDVSAENILALYETAIKYGMNPKL